jgi:hypothetical protein
MTASKSGNGFDLAAGHPKRNVREKRRRRSGERQKGESLSKRLIKNVCEGME